MQLIVITPDKVVNNEAEIVNSLFANGLQRLHLRKPLFTVDDYRGYMQAIDTKYYSRIVLSSSFEMLSEFELGGVHLNSMMRNEEAILAQIRSLPPSFISTSFHSWQEIRENEFGYGYVFISPVFDSISKEGYKAGIDIADAMEIKNELADNNKYCPKIIGLGGVGKDQIPLLQKNGFDGAAILGAIWMANDPVAAFKDITTPL